MLRVNKKTEYAILALLHLGSKRDQVASVREISAVCRVPEPLLSKIMQTLKATGIVAAAHGNQGGYRLTRDLEKISLLEINEALVGPVRLTECLEPGNANCPAQDCCQIVPPMKLLNEKLIGLFGSTSLRSLAAPLKSAGR